MTKDRQIFEANPLHGMSICATYGVAPPEWLAMAYLKGFMAVRDFRVKSWDEAFGAPFRKGVQLAALRERRAARPSIVLAVTEKLREKPDLAIDTQFWEDVGQQANVGKTLAQEIFREAVGMGWVNRASMVGGRPAKLRKLAGIRRRRR